MKKLSQTFYILKLKLITHLTCDFTGKPAECFNAPLKKTIRPALGFINLNNLFFLKILVSQSQSLT